VKAPPTPVQWRIDSEMRGGHSVAEVLAWASWVGDWEDEQQDRRRVLSEGFALAEVEPKWLTKVRSWFGR
jgi:hypothetical protein